MRGASPLAGSPCERFAEVAHRQHPRPKYNDLHSAFAVLLQARKIAPRRVIQSGCTNAVEDRRQRARTPRPRQRNVMNPMDIS